jgi:hypothetical protein
MNTCIPTLALRPSTLDLRPATCDLPVHVKGQAALCCTLTPTGTLLRYPRLPETRLAPRNELPQL